MAVTTAESKHTSRHVRRRAVGRLIALLATALVLAALCPAGAFAIPRGATLARGQSWVDARVSYSQTRYYAGYRTDCSGFVSMCWQTSGSYNTRTLYRVSHPISAEELQPGDALLRANYHVRLFAGWLDVAHTRYVAYEETTPGSIQSLHYIGSDLADGYIPYRYNAIEESPPAWNTLANGMFDVWVGDPIWWTASRDASGTTVARQRTDVVHSGASALGLVNRSKDVSRFAEVKQSVAVGSGRTYTLSAWAWTDRPPSAVRMRLQLFGTDGRTLVDTSTAGDTWGVGPSGMRQMAITQLAPSGTSTATITFRLAGGAYDANDMPGSAVFDDVGLVVPSPMAVYRFWNRVTGAHFYTASPYERDQVANGLWSIYRYEGVAYGVGLTPANNQDLYRFYNMRTGTHFYTASDAERDQVLQNWPGTLRFEGVAYKVAGAPTAGSLAVYRFFNLRNGTHFYTASEVERDQVIQAWPGILRYEGVAFHFVP